MSYNPIDAVSVPAMQLDIASASSLSGDITTHNDSTFVSARYIYFVDVRSSLTVSAGAGLNYWRNWSTGAKFGGTFRGNDVSGTTMMTDESFCGANTITASMTRASVSVGIGTLGSDITFKSIWRIA